LWYTFIAEMPCWHAEIVTKTSVLQTKKMSNIDNNTPAPSKDAIEALAIFNELMAPTTLSSAAVITDAQALNLQQNLSKFFEDQFLSYRKTPSDSWNVLFPLLFDIVFGTSNTSTVNAHQQLFLKQYPAIHLLLINQLRAVVKYCYSRRAPFGNEEYVSVDVVKQFLLLNDESCKTLFFKKSSKKLTSVEDDICGFAMYMYFKVYV